MLAATTRPPPQPPPRTFIGRPGHSLSPSLEGFENHSSSLPVLSQSSSVRREIGMERHLSECPGLEEDHEWELPGEHPERYLPECPGPEEGLEWKLSECPGHPERHLPECGVKSLNRVIVVNRYIDISFQGSRLCQEYHPEKNQSFLNPDTPALGLEGRRRSGSSSYNT